MAKKKFVPYLATTSLRKVIDSMKSHPLNLEITVARGYVRAGNRERTEFHTEVGWKEYENTTYEAELDWHGGGILCRLKIPWTRKCLILVIVVLVGVEIVALYLKS
ncbi:hypothetical protein AKJ41_03035 [candidate division MSBL1 archaeon SCGC-AAA259O05]|uniref:Uncharacterized protein n=1 Tax=candidate division MSBL1 archaeon SCGC-AAA259O05 TaxID=1698271 RepID=A0A133V3L6_9EURY|nr:hypothetical protein AKJ41_03035 [candidate division MSBL1 archaeon SCGC-AAA259O05]